MFQLYKSTTIPIIWKKIGSSIYYSAAASAVSQLPHSDSSGASCGVLSIKSRGSRKQSPILGTTITVERLKKRGYIPVLEIYKLIRPETVMFPMT